MLRLLKQLRRRWRRLLAERRRQAERAFCANRFAYRRSRNLLRRCLSPEQRLEFERRRTFTVLGASGRRYRIGHAVCVNVEVLTADGEIDHRLCAGPTGVPIPAVMLAQKLMLETNEPEFLRIAIRHPASPPLYPGWREVPT